METSKSLEPRQCPRCYAINESDRDFCGKCGLPLTGEARIINKSDEEEAAKLAINPDVLQKMIDDAVNKKLEAMKGNPSN
jgi:hypothetical protein